LFNSTGIKFVSVGGLPNTKAAGNTPYLLSVVFILLDELGWKVQPFSNGDLEGGNTIVVVDEVVGNPGVIEVEVGVLACLHSNVQAVLGIVNACTHRCTVSLPSDLADLDGGNESGNDFA